MRTRIAFISEHASPLAALGGIDAGGQNVYVGELARQLARKGYQVDIYTRRENARYPECIPWSNNIRIIHITAGPAECIEKEQLLPYMTEFRDQMLAFMQREKLHYHLVHANFFMSAKVAMELKEILRIPYVVTFHALGHIRRLHQAEQDRFPPERIRIEQEAIMQADQVIAECPQDMDDLVQYYDAPADKITLVPCGVNPEEFFPVSKELARMELKIPTDEALLLQLGRMVPRKGVDNVIEALARLKYPGRKVRLMIVGGEAETCGTGVNPEIRRLKEIAARLGVQAAVTFTGKKGREELKLYYSAADLFITTPWYEPFGITPLEAMACGTPVIGSMVGGIKYSVLDGKTGALVPPQDPEALAVKIHGLLTDPALLQKMSEAAVKRVRAMFTWQHVAAKMSMVYEQVLANGNEALAGTTYEDMRMIDQSFHQLSAVADECRRLLRIPVRDAARLMCNAFSHGKKILICGNGGSAAESQHFAAELAGRFEIPDRPGLPAISLTADTALLTAWSNDIGFNDIFSRQVQALGRKGDLLFCISTSGNSPNLLRALETARQKGIASICLLGKDGGEAAALGDVNIIVPSSSTVRIQEMQLHVIHTLCRLVEQRLFGAASFNRTRLPDALADSI
ncbi:glycosyltransferase [Chitinophaga sp. YIM B06452]|uniref:glycosyltransferase n=1 Tax=Chitinophaga sp. YIM B06452 TaxID=3082158 RepID=UPI0031FEEACF